MCRKSSSPWLHGPPFYRFSIFEGGIANVAAGQPLDTVKVKMQTFPALYHTGMKCFKETLRVDGFRGLYAGL